MFDQLVQRFLSNRSNKSLNSIPNISTIRKQIHSTQGIIKHLKQEQFNLQKQIGELSNVQWQSKINEIERKKIELNSLLNRYESPEFQLKVKKSILKRQNKRKRLKQIEKKWKNENDLNRKVIMEQREMIHTKIDQWQSTEIAKENERKQKLLTSSRVPQVIGGVTKKKTEAKRFIGLLDGLIELRRVRRIQNRTNELGEKYFCNEIGKLKTIWADALINYEQDERELRKHFVDKDDWIEKQWMWTLFGAESKQNGPVDGSDYKLDDFIRVRQMWDSCIVSSDHPFGSSIPVGWILPNTNPSEQWKVYRDQECL